MAGASGVKAGDVVWANTGGSDWLGLVKKGEHEVNGELKALVQNTPGDDSVLGYREPEDRDGEGAGGTFWLV